MKIDTISPPPTLEQVNRKDRYWIANPNEPSRAWGSEPHCSATNIPRRLFTLPTQNILSYIPRMTPDDLQVAGKKLFGYGWQTRLARELDVTSRTVNRWAAGAVPIPGPVKVAVRLWLQAVHDPHI